MKSRITELLNIKYPIFQGGMAWVADGDLAAAVSKAGGLGIIGGGNAPKEVVKANIDKIKAVTDKPFGVNIMLLSPFVEDIVDLVIEEGVKVVTTGAGNPCKYMKAFKEAGIIVMPVVPSVALAKRMERSGADAIIAEGCESGGHIGELTTMTLLPQVKAAVDIPVIAAGGIASGKQALAALALGADGFQVGTMLLVAKEAPIHENYKQAVLKAHDTSTIVTGRIHGTPVRILKNKMAKAYLEKEKAGASMMELEKFTLGGLRRAVVEGDTETGSLMAGQVAGQLDHEAPVAEIFADFFQQLRDEQKRLAEMQL